MRKVVSTSVRRVVTGVAVVLGFLLLLSGPALADTQVWTTQADFQAGTLVNLDSTTLPGSLILSANATDFLPYSQNPVFGPSATGWDDSMAIASCVLHIGGTWVMWYSGSNGSGSGIGRATSTDGIHWTRNPTTPLLTSAGWPVVTLEGGTYKMWYESTPGAYMPTAIDYATSTDGITWIPNSGNPVLSPSSSGFDSFIVFPGGVVHDASGYRMWYGGNDGSSLTYSVGLATSTDGLSWTKYAGNPIITPPFGGSWATTRVLPSVVLPWKGGLLMGYVGADGSYTQRIALALSADGIHWTPYSTLTLDVGPSGSWDANRLSHFTLADMAGNLAMWYGGTPDGASWSTGLAKAPAYGQLGAFESAVFDSGSQDTAWSTLSWAGSTPPNTSIGVVIQVGNTSTPDLTWASSPPSLASSVALSLPKARYARVIVAFASLDPSTTPTLDSVTVTYQPPSPIEFGGLGTLGFALLLALAAGIAAAVGLILILGRRSKSRAPTPPQQPLTNFCTQCGAAVPAGNGFCGRCGARMNPPGGTAPPVG